MNTKQSIIEIDYAIAFTTGSGKIYVNKHLKDFDRDIYDKVIAHELSHDTGPYDTHDLEEDLNVNFFPLYKKLQFCMKHPKAFAHFSPVIITKDEVCWSWMTSMQWIIYIGMILLMWWWL